MDVTSLYILVRVETRSFFVSVGEISVRNTDVHEKTSYDVTLILERDGSLDVVIYRMILMIIICRACLNAHDSRQLMLRLSKRYGPYPLKS